MRNLAASSRISCSMCDTSVKACLASTCLLRFTIRIFPTHGYTWENSCRYISSNSAKSPVFFGGLDFITVSMIVAARTSSWSSSSRVVALTRFFSRPVFGSKYEFHCSRCSSNATIETTLHQFRSPDKTVDVILKKSQCSAVRQRQTSHERIVNGGRHCLLTPQYGVRIICLYYSSSHDSGLSARKFTNCTV